jgi:TonB family protein
MPTRQGDRNNRSRNEKPPLLDYTPDAMGLSTASTRGGGRLAMLPACLIAAAAHAAIIAGLALAIDTGPVGARGSDLEAVSIEVALVSARALESSSSTQDEAAAASVRVSPEQGTQDLEPVSGPPAARTFPTETSSHVGPFVAAEAEPAPADPTETEVKAATAKPVEPETLHEKDREEPQPGPRTPDAPSANLATGGAPAAASDVLASGSLAAAAASPGEIEHYAAAVTAALARARPAPPGPRLRGSVRIAFVIGADGALAHARVQTSSGVRALDETALAAVRRVRFPPPPRGLSPSQLSYVVPYHFR